MTHCIFKIFQIFKSLVADIGLKLIISLSRCVMKLRLEKRTFSLCAVRLHSDKTE